MKEEDIYKPHATYSENDEIDKEITVPPDLLDRHSSPPRQRTRDAIRSEVQRKPKLEDSCLGLRSLPDQEIFNEIHCT